MANYEATARSNYFRVKDPEAFKTWAGSRELEVIEKAEEFCVLPGDFCESGWPHTRQAEPGDEEYEEGAEYQEPVEIEFMDELAAHLADGEVCILVEVGHEKSRYVVGEAMAFDNVPDSPCLRITLDSISDLAAKRWPDATISEPAY